MKPWQIVAVALLPGGSVILLVAWVCKRWTAKADTTIDRLIKSPVFRPGMEKQNDSLRVKTEARRKAAASLKARAHHVETGEPISTFLSRVK